MIELDLTGQSFRQIGGDSAVSKAVIAALQRCGAVPQGHSDTAASTESGQAAPVSAANAVPPAVGARAKDSAASLLIVSAPVLPNEEFRAAPLLDQLDIALAEMTSGRVILLLSAAGLVPLKRFPRYSAEMASLVSSVRSQAMRRAPQILVNAVAAGLIGDPALTGDPAMVSHAAIKPGATLDPIVDTALFFCDPLNSYTTGQTLAVDGGWSTGFARSF